MPLTQRAPHFQITPTQLLTKNGEKSALKALSRIHAATVSKIIPERNELAAYAVHGDERVPIALLGALNALLEPPFDAVRILDVRVFFSACLRRALGSAAAAGTLWTPLLDSLDMDEPWGYDVMSRIEGYALQEKGRAALDHLSLHPDTEDLQLLGAFRSEPIREVVCASAVRIDEHAVRLALDTYDVPPRRMLHHPKLSPEAAALLRERLCSSYHERLLRFPRHELPLHSMATNALLRTGDHLRGGALVDGSIVPLHDEADLDMLIAILEHGSLGQTASAEVALTVATLDRHDDSSRLQRVWNALSAQGEFDCFPIHVAYDYRDFQSLELEIVSDAVHAGPDASRLLQYIAQSTTNNPTVADRLAQSCCASVRGAALAGMSPARFQRVFSELVATRALNALDFQESSEAQLATLRLEHWDPLLENDYENADVMLSLIPSARTAPDVRAWLLRSTNLGVLARLCRSSEMTAKECSDLFDRIVTEDPRVAVTTLSDDGVVRALRTMQLLPLLTHEAEFVRSAALTALALASSGGGVSPAI